jgi:hypothetical protein
MLGLQGFKYISNSLRVGTPHIYLRLAFIGLDVYIERFAWAKKKPAMEVPYDLGEP